VLSVYFDSNRVEGADGFAHAAVCAFLLVYVEDWALGFLSLLFWLLVDADGFSGASEFADFAAYASVLIQCEFVVFGLQ
jgi:hypothetical protein